MNILYVYNYYQNPGGEDECFAAEAALMESRGHVVRRYTLHNDAINGMSRFVLAGKLMWNRDAAKDIFNIVRDERIDVVHFHNTFPLISPAAYYAAKRAGAKVVHTLHNFRLVCPSALLSREGAVCEECLGKTVPWRGVLHSCYRDSKVQSAALATMLAGHRLTGTWRQQIDRYIALSEFAKQKFIQGGLPAAKITVKPNFIDPDPGAGDGEGGYALFVGRLSVDKGINTLLRAWKALGRQIPLKIAGDGPMAAEVRNATTSDARIEYLGRQERKQVLGLMRGASFLMFPSVWYEGFPMTIVEAYASGLPVIASDLGSMTSIVKHQVTGLRFLPGDVQDLIKSIEWFRTHPREVRLFRINARREYLTNYSAARNYAQLIRIYDDVLQPSDALKPREAA